MAHDEPGGMRRLPTQADVATGKSPRERPSAPHLTRAGLAVLLAVLAEPLALLGELLGVDQHLIFALVWLAAFVPLLPLGRRRWHGLAELAIAIYAIALVLPAGGSSPGDPLVRGYQVLVMPPVGPIRHLPEPGPLMEAVVGLTAWLTNPLLLLAVAIFRLREWTLAIVLSGAAIVFGLMEIAAGDLAVAQVAWLAAPALLAVAAWWARRHW